MLVALFRFRDSTRVAFGKRLEHFCGDKATLLPHIQSIARRASCEPTDKRPRPGVCCCSETFPTPVPFPSIRLVRCLTSTIVALCWLVAFLSGPMLLSAAEVEVRLTNGRILRGAVLEKQLSSEQLVLEQRSSGISLRRTLSWKQIADVRVIVASEKPTAVTSSKPEASIAEEAQASTVSLPLAELMVAAQPVSTFGRMDWDSLRLSLRGFDQLGLPVPLHGTLQVTLWGQREEVGRPRRINTPTGSVDVASQRRFELDKIHTWTRSLDSTIQRLPGIGVPAATRPGVGGSVYEDVTTHPWGASGFGGQSVPNFQGRQDRGRPIYERNPSDVVQMLLSLPQPTPDSDAQRWPLGEVTVELLMPGVGVFSATSPGIVLVHQSPLRQELLQQSGSRFFPGEGTTDSRGQWLNPGQPLQLRQITPPFPTAITP